MNERVRLPQGYSGDGGVEHQTWSSRTVTSKDIMKRGVTLFEQYSEGN
jgi:hypothetical protein